MNTFHAWFITIMTFASAPLLVLIGWFVVDRLGTALVRRGFELAEARFVSNAGDSKSVREASLRRFQTLGQLTCQIVRGTVAVLAVLTLLGSMRVDVRPILTGVGVAGLAISLAAQNIIRDFLNGIFVVMEDHYAVGDVIRAGDVTGVVERFSLRTTQIRTLDGELAIVPNGTLSGVTNFARNWSRARIDVGVAYETDIPRAMEVMKKVGVSLQEANPEMIIESPEVQGIIEFGDSSITLRCLIRTFPGQQWEVGRQYRLRLKEAFNAAGIVFPFPQMDLWVRDQGEGVPKTTA